VSWLIYPGSAGEGQQYVGAVLFLPRLILLCLSRNPRRSVNRYSESQLERRGFSVFSVDSRVPCQRLACRIPKTELPSAAKAGLGEIALPRPWVARRSRETIARSSQLLHTFLMTIAFRGRPRIAGVAFARSVLHRIRWHSLHSTPLPPRINKHTFL